VALARLVEVTICNSQYTIKTEAEEAYIQSIARYVNQKIQEVQEKTKSVSTLNVVILAALNTADELFRERDRHQKSIESVENRSKDLINMIEKET
jgi:cell division protein ZapA